MQYTIRWIRTSRSTNIDIKKLEVVKTIAKRYETASSSDDESQYQVFESAKDLQKFIQNFVEECNADYSVEKIGVMRSNMTLEVKLTLDPFTNSPVPVSICFEPKIGEALTKDAEYLENQLY